MSRFSRGDAERFEELAGGDRAGSRAVDDDFNLFFPLASDFKRVEQGRAGNDRSAVLVVMEDGDIEFFDQALFDLEAFGRFDVFQVDAAEGWRERFADVDDFLGAAGSDLDIEDIDIGKLLEEHAFAFHDRLGCQWSAVAQAEDGAAVGDHGDKICARGHFEDGERILVDLEHGFGDAGRIGEREVKLAIEWLGRDDLNFAGSSQPMVVERFLSCE